MTCLDCKKKIDPQESYGTGTDGSYLCQTCLNGLVQLATWGLFQPYPDQWHIQPLDEEHLQDGVLCGCKPKAENVNGITLVTHSSFDGREGFEEALRILNQKN